MDEAPASQGLVPARNAPAGEIVRVGVGEEQNRAPESVSALLPESVSALLPEALDALGEHVALLGPGGEVLAVNRAWAEFAAQNGYRAGGTGLGWNYCDVCEAASGPGSEEAKEIAAGIRQLLAGRADYFGREYPCNSPTQERWFKMAVRRVVRPGPIRAIVTHTDTTRERIAARAAADAQADAEGERAKRAIEEALFRSLTERSHEFVSVLNANGEFKYVGPSSVCTLGYSPEELLGTRPVDLVHPDDRATMLETYFSLVNGGHGAVARMTVRLRRKDGEWRYFEGGGQNLLHDPSICGIMSNARDVTTRLAAERARQQSDARFRQFVETTQEGVLAVDSSGRITYANSRMEALVGYGSQDLLGRDLSELLPVAEPGHESIGSSASEAVGTGAIGTCMRRWDGRLLDVIATESAITDVTGAQVGVLAIVHDVTERTRTERAMAEAFATADLDRRRLEATLEALPVGVWLADATGRITHINPAASRLWGGRAPHAQSIEEYATYRARWPESGAPVTAEAWPLARTLVSGAGVAAEVIEIERFDGGRSHGLTSSAPIFDAAGRLSGAVVVMSDVTELEAAAKERERLVVSLATERAQLEAVFERAPAFLAVGRGPDHIFQRVNPAYQQLVGDRKLIGKSVAEALPELRDQGFIELLDHVRATGEPFVGNRVPVQLSRVAGAPLETRYVDFVYQRIEQADGDHVLVAHGVDVTEQVLATEKLRRNEERLRDQFAKLPVPAFLWRLCSGEFILIECNDAALAALGHPGAEIFGKRRREIFPGTEDVDEALFRCLNENIVVRRSVEIDVGSPPSRRRFDLTIGAQQPDCVLVHAVDMTERTQLEVQLRHAQKMEAVGQLAGGVAHDFNNLLTIISAHSSFLMDSLPADDPQREDAMAIHKAGERAAGLTRQLLAFSRKQILKPVVQDLNERVVETRAMLDRLLGEDIEITVNLGQQLQHIVADPGQIDQVLVNLAVNARDAMEAGGRLTISTQMVTIGSDERDTQGILLPGDYVTLIVRDTGHGMDATVRARLFEPFFTTKELGKGTGLGLATVYGIVKQSGGYITVDSGVGIGTSFFVYFPAVPKEEEAYELQEAERAAERGVETVLLVEDEPKVRDVARRVLRRHGYVVLEAHDGECALSISESFESVIHLVVSDAVIPGVPAGEVVRQLQQSRPELKALFVSGYTAGELSRRGIVSDGAAFLAKPYSAHELTRAVREVLDGAVARRACS